MLGALSKLAGQVASGISGAIERLVNEDELNAVVAAAVLIAGAEGGISAEEKEAAFTAIARHEALKAFPSEKIRNVFNEYVGLVEADATLASDVLFGKLTAVKDITARIKLLGIAQQVANADGKFSDAEKRMVDAIRRRTA